MCEQQHSHFIKAYLLRIIWSCFLELSKLPSTASHKKLILHSGICRIFLFKPSLAGNAFQYCGIFRSGSYSFRKLKQWQLLGQPTPVAQMAWIIRKTWICGLLARVGLEYAYRDGRDWAQERPWAWCASYWTQGCMDGGQLGVHVTYCHTRSGQSLPTPAVSQSCP